MREGPGTERLGTAQRRTTLPVLAGERGGCGQTLGGQGCLRPDGEPGEESVVGLRGGTWQRMAPSSPRSSWPGRAREQQPRTRVRVRLHSAPSVPACDPGQVPEALPATVPAHRSGVKELSLKASQRPRRVCTRGQVEGSMHADVHTEGTHVVHVGELDLQGCEQGARRGLHRHRDDLGVQDSCVPGGQPTGHAGVRSPSPHLP